MGNSQIDNIAYAFMSHYYTALNEDPVKVGKMYELNAVLNHSDPQSPFSQTESLTGNQAISKHLQNSLLKGCKVVCFTIDVQPVKDDGILICCMGELTLAKEQQCKSFTQTFLLVKAGEKIYDISNDVLKFIPDVDGMNKTEPQSSEPEAEKVDSKANVDSKTEDVDPVEIESERVEVPEKVESSKPQEPEEPEKSEEPEKKDPEPQEPETKESEPAPESNPVEEQTPQQLSWAARAAVARSEQLKKSALENGEAKKKTVKKSKEVKEQTKEVKDSKEQPIKSKKGEGAFPIYIKGIERDIEPLLVGELETHFGKVEYCKIERFVALVSFAEQQAQVKALETKQLTIKSRTIKLEPRIKRNDERKRKNTPKQQKKPQTKKIDDDGFKKVGK